MDIGYRTRNSISDQGSSIVRSRHSTDWQIKIANLHSICISKQTDITLCRVIKIQSIYFTILFSCNAVELAFEWSRCRTNWSPRSPCNTCPGTTYSASGVIQENIGTECNSLTLKSIAIVHKFRKARQLLSCSQVVSLCT